MKKTTTIRGAARSRREMEKARYKARHDLPQMSIQTWIERIPCRIEEIIRLKGGHEYKEGRKAFQREYKGTRLKGKPSTHAYLTPRCNPGPEDEDWENIDEALAVDA
jgi:hypothetical protein